MWTLLIGAKETFSTHGADSLIFQEQAVDPQQRKKADPEQPVAKHLAVCKLHVVPAS